MQANRKQNFNFNLKYSTLYFASQNSVLCEAVNPLIKQSAEKFYTLCSMRLYLKFPM